MAKGGLSIEFSCKNLEPVRRIIEILKMITEDPRAPENVRKEYRERVESVKFEGDE